MNPSEIADTLDKAADLLWLRGRCVGTGEESDGRLCVLGAVLAAQGKDPQDVFLLTYRDPVRVALQTYLGGEHISAWIWSDRRPVTPENDAYIVDQIRRCAKSLRESSCS